MAIDNEELYRKYRPKRLDEIVGQKEQVRTIKQFLKKGKLPHVIMFSGMTGVGKTTIARILKEKLKCSDGDYKEINCASDRGIEMSRDITQYLHTSALGGSSRIWVLDEFHQATGPAQQALLKTLEDVPTFSYIFLLTSEPAKVIKAIQSRATQIKLDPLHGGEICQLILEIAKKEKIKVSEDVRDKIAAVVQGSARKALVLLNQIRYLKSEEQMIEAIQKADLEKAGFDLAKLLFAKGTTWKEIGALLKIFKEQEEQAEDVRRIVLGYASSVCINSGGAYQKRAAAVLNAFRDPYYDVGLPGLTLSCYDAMFG